MKSREYLEEIRKAEGLKRAVLRKIEVKKGVATFHLATDLTYSDKDVSYARSVSEKYAEGLAAEVKIVKAVPSEEGVRAGILEILRSRFPAVAAFVNPEMIAVEAQAGGGRFTVRLGANEKSVAEGVLDSLIFELSRRFCGVWQGEFRFEEQEREKLGEIEIPPAEILFTPRTFPIEEYGEIDGGKAETAIYISDLTREMEGVSVCGVVSYIEERLTKKEKPYFTITLSDGTAQLRVSYFSRKATVEKIRAIKQGASICLTGDNELYNGSLSFRAKQIDLGRAPKDFVPKERPSRPVPLRYKAVFPLPISDFVQSKLFEEKTPLPEEVLNTEYVSFDLETTGKNNSPSSTMDHITEIGAVKIKNGTIVEKFSSFIACPVKLSAEIIELTGITDDMLVGAPSVADVMADFYKFADGCVLVGHNVQFDCKFINYYGGREGYRFNNRTMDTWLLAQKQLFGLSNYKLNTVADYFGFTFNHHRAFDDAFVTAKIFLELMRLK